MPIQQSASPRKFLELFGIDQTQIETFRDGQPIGEDDGEALTKVLHRVPQFTLADIHRWTSRAVSLEQLAAEPEKHRAEMVRLTGRVRRVDPVALIPELARLYDFNGYFRVRVQLDRDRWAVVCSRRVPSSWAIATAIDEPTRIDGLFLKIGPAPESENGPAAGPAAAPLVFASARVGWLPDRVAKAQGVHRDLVTLAKLGFDASLLDDVRRTNRRGMGAREREGFYQMLAAVKQSDPAQLAADAARDIDLAPLLQDPDSQHGRLMHFRGTVRRITRVEVGEPDVQQRYGIDHYYQMDVFVPLGERTVRLGKPNAKGESPVFTNNYPVTFCVTELPGELAKVAARLTAGELESETLHEQVELTGFYFKLWSYRSEYVASFDNTPRQISPMILALKPKVVQLQLNTRGQNPWWGLLAGLGALGVVLAVWMGIWRANRGDSKFSKQTLKKRYEVSDDKSLDEMGIEASDGPDFSNLDQS